MIRSPKTNEHMVPFAHVTATRLLRGIHTLIREKRLAHEWFDLPDGTLYMHPADYEDLMVGDDGEPFTVAWQLRDELWRNRGAGRSRIFGAEITLITTQDPDVVRAGRPLLRLHAFQQFGFDHPPTEAYL